MDCDGIIPVGGRPASEEGNIDDAGKEGKIISILKGDQG